MLGDAVKRWRLELGWTQMELARRSRDASGHGLTQVQVSELESNKYPNPSVAAVQAVARAFGCSVDALLAAAERAVDQIPTIVEALPPDLAGLPGWARDFHRWGARLSPTQRQRVLDLVRALAEESAGDTKMQPNAELEPEREQDGGRGRR